MSKNIFLRKNIDQMLVKDGDRRFQEWHSRFLDYQRAYQEDMNKRKSA